MDKQCVYSQIVLGLNIWQIQNLALEQKEMKTPDIKIRKIGDDVICSITYDGKLLEAGYKPDGTTFVLSDRSMVNTSNDFTTISCKMWDEVLKKFSLNPGCALEAGLIDLKYCKQMQFASIIGYDLGELVYNHGKSHRNMEQFFEEHLK